ncbi:terminase family protein [Pseudohaliea sp.]|uniref:terminase large subunit domain-containing protein n=1 Tax=Pseudohaliea sp. TaxID=2740289 RepID=UPI0032EFBC15
MTLAIPPELHRALRYRYCRELFAEEVCGLQLDDWQRDVLSEPYQPTILCCSRQVGKTECVALLAASQCILVPGSFSLVVSTGREHAGTVLSRIKDYIRKGEEQGLCQIDSDNATRIQLDNGAGVACISSSPKAGRGFVVKQGLLIVDEAAFLPDEEGGEAGVIDSLLPTISAGHGTPILLSTPNGRLNRFAQIWHSGDEYWRRISVPWTDCPRLNAGLMATIRASIPPAVFDQEYCCSFAANSMNPFTQEMLAGALGGQSPPASAHEPDAEDPVIQRSQPFSLLRSAAHANL